MASGGKSSKLPESYHVEQLKFGNRSISDHFTNGDRLDVLAKDIMYGKTTAQRMPPLEVKLRDGHPHVVDGNRRLKVYKSLADAEFGLGKIPVKCTEDPKARVLVRPGEGDEIDVRGGGDPSELIRMEKDTYDMLPFLWDVPEHKREGIFNQQKTG